MPARNIVGGVQGQVQERFNWFEFRMAAAGIGVPPPDLTIRCEANRVTGAIGGDDETLIDGGRQPVAVPPGFLDHGRSDVHDQNHAQTEDREETSLAASISQNELSVIRWKPKS